MRKYTVRKVTFVAVIGVIAIMLLGLFLSVYAIPRLREIFAPDPWSLYPPPAEHELIDIYFNETDWEARGTYLYSGIVQARKFEVRIDSFSEELTLIRGSEVITIPYLYVETYGKFEGRPCSFGFEIIAPNKRGEYEVILRFIVSNGWLSIREYPQKIRVRVAPTPYKLKPEEMFFQQASCACRAQQAFYRP